MGSLTSSLLGSSAKMRDEDADALKQSQATPANSTPAKPNSMQKGLNKVGSEVKKAVAPVTNVLGSFHDGGTVPKTGKYLVHEGEEVIPAENRSSEYRKVYLDRKSKKD